MAAASICYNGPFIYSYRVSLENDWRKKIQELNIIHTEGITMKSLLENPIEVNEWKLNGLPNDNLSIELMRKNHLDCYLSTLFYFHQ